MHHKTLNILNTSVPCYRNEVLLILLEKWCKNHPFDDSNCHEIRKSVDAYKLDNIMQIINQGQTFFDSLKHRADYPLIGIIFPGVMSMHKLTDVYGLVIVLFFFFFFPLSPYKYLCL